MIPENHSGNVALLIDFENLVLGVDERDSVDCDVLFRLAEEYGRVLVANAYADWRFKQFNQYQMELYRRGAEIVPVLGKMGGSNYKNAVDVKMAVDAIGALSAYPHIDVFVIVSGDRDFIHVLRALRRQGKYVIGVSPRSGASADFASLCDRFVQYDALAATYEAPGAEPALPSSEDRPDLASVRRALAAIAAGRTDGIKGAMIKPLLRRELSATFDESNYGFERMSDLLRAMPDVVAVVHPSDGSDVIVYPAGADGDRPAVPEGGVDSECLRLMRDARLSFYRFERDAAKRRAVLTRLYDAIAAKSPFTWEEIERRLLDDAVDSAVPMTVTVLARYYTMFYHSRAFVFEPDQGDLRVHERLMHLRDGIHSAGDFMRLYEGSVAYKVRDAAEGNLPPETLAEILGLPPDEDSSAYCTALLKDARIPNPGGAG